MVDSNALPIRRELEFRLSPPAAPAAGITAAAAAGAGVAALHYTIRHALKLKVTDVRTVALVNRQATHCSRRARDARHTLAAVQALQLQQVLVQPTSAKLDCDQT